jgi:hypothetical protein
VDAINEHAADWDALGVLLWKLGVWPEIPSYAETFDPTRLFQSTGIRAAEPETLPAFIERVTAPNLTAPSSRALSEASAAAELWHWRARAQLMLQFYEQIEEAKRNPNMPLPDDLPDPRKVPAGIREMMRNLPKAITAIAVRAQEKGVIPQVLRNDFAVEVNGETFAYGELKPAQLDKMRAIARARRQAFCWLTGRIQAWDEKIPEELERLDTGDSVWAIAQD